MPTPANPHRPPTPWRRYGWLPFILVPAAVFAGMIVFYGRATDWYFFRAGLPEFEQARAKPELMEPLAAAVGLPVPDLREMDVDLARGVYDAYAALRRDRDDIARIRSIADLYRQAGDDDRAQACDRLAATLAARH